MTLEEIAELARKQAERDSKVKSSYNPNPLDDDWDDEDDEDM